MTSRPYLKLDPYLPERKDYYPDGPWRALVTTFCLAAQQPRPGLFRDEKVLRVLLGRFARHVPFLLAEGDLTILPGGAVSVVGWAEWNEGEFPSVKARMEAIENRRRPMSPADRAFLYRQRQKRDASRVTPSVTVLRDASRDAPSDRTFTGTSTFTGTAPAKKNGSNDRAKNDERIAELRAQYQDEATPSWKREAIKAQLELMGAA
jgi:hypothetical protein